MANSTGNISANTVPVKCNPLAIKEFPPDIFSEHQRDHGAILLHFGAAFYAFGALSYLCDQYFVPMLEFLVDRFKIKPDIAGATLMAIGSSSPELFTSLIGVFVAKDDVGLGAIVGSAVFNILLVIGCCILVAPPGSMNLQVYSVIRDSSYYVLALIPLEVVCWDQHVSWYDAVILVILYCGFILVMYLNGKLERKVINCLPFLESKHNNYHQDDEKSPILSQTSEVGATMSYDEDEFSCDESNISGRKSRSPHGQRSNSSRLIDLSRGSSRNSNQEGKAEADTEKYASDTNLYDTYCSQFSFPDRPLNQFFWILGLPMVLLFAFTIPNPKQNCSKNLYPITFLMCLLYIGLLSYFLVWMVTIIGFTVGVPDIILGLVFLSAGSSVPDALSSIIVSRHGQGDMAVSNCIGSNVFDILIGLGLPWLVKTTVFGTTVKIYSGSIHYTVLVLLGSIITMNLVFIASKWSPRWPSGLALLIFYVSLITLACLFEMNVLGKYNLPPCKS